MNMYKYILPVLYCICQHTRTVCLLSIFTAFSLYFISSLHGGGEAILIIYKSGRIDFHTFFLSTILIYSPIK